MLSRLHERAWWFRLLRQLYLSRHLRLKDLEMVGGDRVVAVLPVLDLRELMNSRRAAVKGTMMSYHPKYDRVG